MDMGKATDSDEELEIVKMGGGYLPSVAEAVPFALLVLAVVAAVRTVCVAFASRLWIGLAKGSPHHISLGVVVSNCISWLS